MHIFKLQILMLNLKIVKSPISNVNIYYTSLGLPQNEDMHNIWSFGVLSRMVHKH